MEKKNKYNYNTFKELFDYHIQYAYEGQYGCSLSVIKYEVHNLKPTEAATFHKLTIYDIGWLEYKGHWEQYDERLWPKVKQLVELLQETAAEKVLYGRKSSPDETQED